MSIFDAYDQEFTSLNQEIGKNVAELKNLSGSGPSDTKVSSLIRQIEGLFSQSNELIKQMKIEARSHDTATKKVLADKIGHYEKSNASLKSDFERAKEQASRSSLIGAKSQEQRQRLLDTNDKITRQNEMIANAHRTVLETEEVGNEITAELARNREKINSARERANEFSGITDSARRVLASMSRRDVRQRYMIFFIAAVLIVAISITIYFSTKK
eukprot:gene5345-7416_t